MGWSVGYGSYKETRDNVLGSTFWREGYKVIASRSLLGKVWAVIERSNGERFIYLALIRKFKKDDGYDGLQWGYKDMDETMGPSQVDCPLSYLTLAPLLPINEKSYAPDWRDRVIDYWAKRKRKFEIGMKVKIDGRLFTISQKIKRHWLINDSIGRIYRLPATHAEIVV